MMFNPKALFAGLVAVAMSASAAGAVSFSFDWSVDETAPAFSDPGLVVQVAPNSGSVNTGPMSVGDSVSFDLFTIYTDEQIVNFDDLFAQSFAVGFTFTVPAGAGGSLSASSVGEILPALGSVTFDNPLSIAFGPQNSGLLSIVLTSTAFNQGNWFQTLNPGIENWALVTGTLTYQVAPVPVPAALPLLATAFAALVAVRRRRQAA